MKVALGIALTSSLFGVALSQWLWIQDYKIASTQGNTLCYQEPIEFTRCDQCIACWVPHDDAVQVQFLAHFPLLEPHARRFWPSHKFFKKKNVFQKCQWVIFCFLFVQLKAEISRKNIGNLDENNLHAFVCRWAYSSDVFSDSLQNLMLECLCYLPTAGLIYDDEWMHSKLARCFSVWHLPVLSVFII